MYSVLPDMDLILMDIFISDHTGGITILQRIREVFPSLP